MAKPDNDLSPDTPSEAESQVTGEINHPFPKRSPRWKRWFRFVLYSFLTLLLFIGCVWVWYTHRPMPSSLRREIFQGVTYIRDVRTRPRKMIVHVLEIKLDAPGLSFLVTPGDPKKPRPLKASLTSQFAKDFHLQAAINGDFFFPWHSKAPWDYYPHIGDSVELEGLAASKGVMYSIGEKKGTYPWLYTTADNHAGFMEPASGVTNIISGDHLFLTNGVSTTAPDSYHTEPQPRTAVALTEDRTKMIWIVVDGRQPNYSEGATMEDLAQIALDFGAYNALNFDGGGSTTLVVQGKDGKPEILNCPIDCHIPGRERPVANHLGLFAQPLGKQAVKPKK
jgi:hypothetical protein